MVCVFLKQSKSLGFRVFMRESSIRYQECIRFRDILLGTAPLLQENGTFTFGSEQVTHHIGGPSPDIPIGPVARSWGVNNQQCGKRRNQTPENEYPSGSALLAELQIVLRRALHRVDEYLEMLTNFSQRRPSGRSPERTRTEWQDSCSSRYNRCRKYHHSNNLIILGSSKCNIRSSLNLRGGWNFRRRPKFSHAF